VLGHVRHWNRMYAFKPQRMQIRRAWCRRLVFAQLGYKHG
jgi:hypothetical protein